MDTSSFRLERLSEQIEVCVSRDHRFGADAFLLADFARPQKGCLACDLGSGCGIIPLLWNRPPFDLELGETGGAGEGPMRCFAVDIQEQAVWQAEESVRVSGLEGRVIPVLADLTDLEALGAKLPFEKFDLVTCNPPYFPPSSGEVSQGEAGRGARHETLCTLKDVCIAAGKLLRFGGRFCLCLRPERLPEAFAAMGEGGLVPKRLRFVCQRPESAPWLFLLEGKKGGGPGLHTEPPLIVEDWRSAADIPGAFSPEMLRIYHKKSPLAAKEKRESLPRGLYLVGTPIGSGGALSPLGERALRRADFLIAEHGKNGLRLCKALSIPAVLGKAEKGEKELFDYNYLRHTLGFAEVLTRMMEGQSAAMVSDAGLPCIADPGWELVDLCHKNGIPVHTAPGPNAAVTALAASGFSPTRFSFEGFLTTAKAGRRAHLSALAARECPLVFYETVKKLPATLKDLLDTLGDREILLAKDLEKPGEKLRRTTLKEALTEWGDHPQKGEFVLVVSEKEKSCK